MHSQTSPQPSRTESSGRTGEIMTMLDFSVEPLFHSVDSRVCQNAAMSERTLAGLGSSAKPPDHLTLLHSSTQMLCGVASSIVTLADRQAATILSR